MKPCLPHRLLDLYMFLGKKELDPVTNATAEEVDKMRNESEFVHVVKIVTRWSAYHKFIFGFGVLKKRRKKPV